MVHIKAFQAIHPPFNRAATVACPPYDVMSTAEARALAGDHGESFLHVIRPEIDLPAGTDPHANEVYEMAAANFHRLCAQGSLLRDEQPGMFLYRQVLDGHSQVGLVCCCKVTDYLNNTIRKHERTRPDKEDDRTRHVRTVDAHTGPVFLTYRDHDEIRQLVTYDSSARPLFHFKSPDGVTHTGWKVDNPETYVAAFDSVPLAYVADGHHRIASAARAAQEIAEENGQGEIDGREESDWFLSVLFPASDLQILPYNRIVKRCGPLAGPEAATLLGSLGTYHSPSNPDPQRPGSFGIYLNGQWSRLDIDPDRIPAHDPIGSLDVSLLHDLILDPILDIADERTDPAIEFVGGIRGNTALAARVDELGDAVAFSLNPTTIDQLLAVADADRCMPPKSTWFEPKLRSGLFVHALDSVPKPTVTKP